MSLHVQNGSSVRLLTPAYLRSLPWDVFLVWQLLVCDMNPPRFFCSFILLVCKTERIRLIRYPVARFHVIQIYVHSRKRSIYPTTLVRSKSAHCRCVLANQHLCFLHCLEAAFYHHSSQEVPSSRRDTATDNTSPCLLSPISSSTQPTCRSFDIDHRRLMGVIP